MRPKVNNRVLMFSSKSHLWLVYDIKRNVQTKGPWLKRNKRAKSLFCNMQMSSFPAEFICRNRGVDKTRQTVDLRDHCASLCNRLIICNERMSPGFSFFLRSCDSFSVAFSCATSSKSFLSNCLTCCSTE